MSKLAPEFALLKPSHKALVRKLGDTDDHTITLQESISKGWEELWEQGWVKIHDNRIGGGTVMFTLSGWEWWCRQVDADEGLTLTPLSVE